MGKNIIITILVLVVIALLCIEAVRSYKTSAKARVVCMLVEHRFKDLERYNEKYHLDEVPLDGDYTIIYALKLQDGTFVEMLDHKYNLNVTDKVGLTPLNFAITCCSERVVDRLISSGADVNYYNFKSPAYLAVYSMSDAAKKYDLLLSHRAAFANEDEKKSAIKMIENININAYIKKINEAPIKGSSPN